MTTSNNTAPPRFRVEPLLGMRQWATGEPDGVWRPGFGVFDSRDGVGYGWFEDRPAAEAEAERLNRAG